MNYLVAKALGYLGQHDVRQQDMKKQGVGQQDVGQQRRWATKTSGKKMLDNRTSGKTTLTTLGDKDVGQ